MRSALAILAMTLPAYAEPVHRWGNSSVTLGPSDAPAVARLDYHKGYGAADATEEMTVTLGGLFVYVYVQTGVGAKPDTFTVTVPEGFVAVPQTGVVEEDTGVVIEIFSISGVGL